MRTHALSLAAAPALALVAGLALATLGLPLGWLLGAATASGAVAISGRDVWLPVPVQRGGIVLLGASTGLVVTPGVGGLLLAWLPLMLLSLAGTLLLAVALVPIYARLAGIDRATAFFSLLPGGIIEMATIGDRHDANRAVITAAHTARVGLIVLSLPVLASVLAGVGAGADAGAADPPPVPTLDAASSLWVVLIGAAGGVLAGWLRVPANWLLGPIVLVSALSLGGWLAEGALPGVLIVIAQLVVGMALGARFRRDTLMQVPRALLSGVPLLLVMGGSVAAAALLLSPVVPTSAVTLLLATAGGGVAELVLAAKVLNAQLELVVGFHIVRLVLVNLCAGWLWTLLHRHWQAG
jgi:uncharacterized protein